MDKPHYNKAKLKLSMIFFGIIFVIIQIFSIYFVSTRYQVAKRFENFGIDDLQPMPPARLRLMERIETERATALQEVMWAQISLSLLGAISSYFLAEFALRPIQKNIEKQNNFLMFASHELRTPLTNLMLLTEEATGINGLSVKEEVEKLRNSTEKYLELLTKEGDNFTPKFEEINISDLITEVLNRFEYTLKFEKINVKNNIQPDLIISSDYSALSTIFRNIFENSIKNIGEIKEIEILNVGDSEIIVTNSAILKQKGYGLGTKIIQYYQKPLKFTYNFEIIENVAYSKLKFLKV